MQKINGFTVFYLLICLMFFSNFLSAQTGVSYISAYGYDSCIELKNKTTTVILEPNAGGRVISYSLNGINIMYEDSLQNRWVSTPKCHVSTVTWPVAGLILDLQEQSLIQIYFSLVNGIFPLLADFPQDLPAKLTLLQKYT
jgi:hypothetical protein